MSLIMRMNPSYEGVTYRAKRDPRHSKLFLGNSMRWQRQGWGQCWARIHTLTFEHAGKLDVTVVVEKAGAMDDMPGMKM